MIDVKKPIIEFQNLGKIYAGNIQALKDLTLTVPQGSIFGFLGPNGAGKTTTIKILLNFIRRYEGEVKLFDQRHSDTAHCSIMKKIGYVPENVALPQTMTVNALLNYSARIYGVNNQKKTVLDVLTQVGMERFRNKRIGKLSKGQKQRVSIANALLHQPTLLVLDEPTSGLDALARTKFLQFIKKWTQDTGGTIFLSSHILGDIDKVCTHIAILDQGELITHGRIQDIRSKYIQPNYLIEFEKQPFNIKNLEQLDYIEKVEQTYETAETKTISVTVADLKNGSQCLLNFFSEQNIFIRKFIVEEPTLERTFTLLIENNHTATAVDPEVST